MSDQYVGEIRMFAGNYAPEGWAPCDGRVLNISQNEVLFSLIGTTYGGDGQTTFAVPDLRGRVPISQGKAKSGTTYPIAQKGGVETVTLNELQLPAHTHSANANQLPGEVASAQNAYWASGLPYSNQAPNALMEAGIVMSVGGQDEHPNVMPFFVVNFIIALQGNYPNQP